MLHVAAQYGTVLTFDHQRRLGKPFRRAAKLLRDGVMAPALSEE